MYLEDGWELELHIAPAVRYHWYYKTTKYERLTPTYVRLTIRSIFGPNPIWDLIGRNGYSG